MKISDSTGQAAIVPVWLVERITPRALAVFVILAGEVVNYSTDAGEISKAKLAERCGISVSTLEAAIRELAAVGVVEKVVRKSGDGSHLPNAYVIDRRTPESRGGGQDLGEGVTRDLVPPSLQIEHHQKEASTDVDASASSPPRTVRVGGRDLAYDAVAEVCGIRVGSPRARGIPAAVNGDDGIRAQWWAEIIASDRWEWNDPEQRERQFAIDIRARAVLYRRKMPGIALTPSALKKWWTDLPGMEDARDGRSGSGADAARIADEVLQRRRQG